MPARAARHTAQRPRHTDNRSAEKRERDKFYKRAAWRKFRAWFLSQPDNVVCAECRRLPSIEVDHIQTVADRPDLALDPSNCRGLCVSCHSRRTMQDQNDHRRAGEG